VAEGGEIAVTRRSLRSIMLDIDHKSTAPPARGFNQMASLDNEAIMRVSIIIMNRFVEIIIR
jgi:hypothetical protein